MTIVSGTRLGPYEIVAPLGAGGMGESFRRTVRCSRRSKDAATPQALFPISGPYDVTPDGQRFLTAVAIDHPAKRPLTLVTNWSAPK